MPPKKKKRSARRGKRKPAAQPVSRQLRVLLASLALVGFLLVSLVLLHYWQQSVHPRPKVVPTPSMVAKPAPVTLDQIPSVLAKALAQIGIAREKCRIITEHGLPTLVVDEHFPPPNKVDELTAAVRKAIPRVHIEPATDSWALTVVRNGQLVGRVRFQPLPPEPVTVPTTAKPRLAIIMDDMGRDLSTVESLLHIDLAVTFSILPYNEEAARTASLGHAHGREILLHIPMEPEGFPEKNPGPDALLLSLSDREIRHRLQDYRKQVPYAVGGNNHMGSQFTQNRAKMTVVIDEMRKSGMFFIDSRTTNRSVAFAVARASGVPVTGRDVFLDNVKDVDLIAREIRKLVHLAIRRGRAVGICHPYPQTLEALRREAAFVHSQGVEVVPASRLAR